LAAQAALSGGVVCAQAPPAPPRQPPDAPLQEEAMKNAAAPCVEPAPMVRLEDYDGPLKKVWAPLPGRWNARRCTPALQARREIVHSQAER